MAYNSPSCVAVLGKTGLSNCKDELTQDAMLVWTTLAFQFASEADAEDESKWIDGINLGTVFPHPIFDEVEPAVEDNVIQETAIGVKLFVREGKYGGIGRAITAQCNLANLRTFNEVTGRAFIVTGNGKIYGTSPDGTIFRGFLLSEFHVGFLGGSDGATKRMVQWDYQMKLPTEMGDFGAVPQITWNPLTQLTGVVPVTIAVVGVATASELIVSIIRDCDNEVVTGLVEADFVILDAGANVQPTTGFTDNADGTYTFTFSADLETGTVNLETPTAQTTGQLFSATVASYTI